jgi:hypothetical protein
VFEVKIISKIKTKFTPFAISVIGFSLLIGLTTSCSSTTPSDEIPPVAEGSEITNQISQEKWRDNRKRYLKSVEQSLYEEEGITHAIIESNQGGSTTITVDEEVFLIQSCEHNNKEACEFLKSQPNQF